MFTQPIQIAGAGLSGLAAAINLARSGHKVVVHEKNPDSGQNRSTDWDIIENWTTESNFTELLSQWGLQPNFLIRSKHELELFDDRGECFPVLTRQPLLYVVKRGIEDGSIEQGLKEQALDLGVEIHYNQTSRQEEVDIWATGPEMSGFFLDVGVTFHTDAPDTTAALINPSAAPKSYAYLGIIEGLGAISVILTQDFHNARVHLNHAIEIFSELKRLDIRDLQISSGFSGRSFAVDQALTHPIRVGEAAGFQDYLGGFGIRQALYSGYLAAQAIHRSLDYETLANREIRPLIRSSVVNRMFYDLAGEPIFRRFFRRFATSPSPLLQLRQLYRRPMLANLLWPIARNRYRERMMMAGD